MKWQSDARFGMQWSLTVLMVVNMVQKSFRKYWSSWFVRVPMMYLEEGGRAIKGIGYQLTICIRCVCVYVFDEGFLLFERFAWNETIDLMSHSVGESGKISGDQRRSIEMTQKRRL